ncbi:TPA: pheST operon leader peptide PheM [Enterobacter cloacae]|nr:pheST operon leader peptide PheM [Enterobacter cloacae]EFM6334006.1 pheST operon leader peptide PheM [Escherichia coli]MCK6720631.1 pheST operon leader peptide PheM [Enterobacter cloacae]MDA6570514.1 pheST operon leader peptide PheM [Escherichia coli]HBN5336297.1 pheST operon leader peptide PheM [Enterobacter cloacae]HDW2926452.1 pheST operon leader peptide PheM [Escherichia coli]
MSAAIFRFFFYFST